jgi:hypothetical protein
MKGTNADGMEGKNDLVSFSSIILWVRSELARVATIVIKPAWPKTIRIEAIRRLCRFVTINSASEVVKPVEVKQERA